MSSSSAEGGGSEILSAASLELEEMSATPAAEPDPNVPEDYNHSTDNGLTEEQDYESLSPSVRQRKPNLLKKARKMIPEPIKSSLKPPKGKWEWLDFLLMKVPIIKWVWGYKVNYIIGDIIAGITVAIMHIPQGLAYALLANVDPIFGLYTSFVPVIVYSILGTSKHISVGTFAVVELMIGNSVDRVLSSDSGVMSNCLDIGTGNDSMVMADDLMGLTGMNGSDVIFEFYGQNTTCSDVRLDVVVTLAMLSGLIMFLMGVFQLGFITIFLSEPLISGYTTGAAVHVFTSQLQHITGLADTIKVDNGPLKVPKTWIVMFQNIGSVNSTTIIVSIIAIIILIVFKVLNKLLKSPKVKVPVKIYKMGAWTTRWIPWPVPIPSQLIVVIVATIVSYFAELEKNHNVIPVGDIPTGLPSITVPNVRYIPILIQDAFVIGIVTFAVTVSLAKVFAREFGYSVNSNQELFAYGMMNIVGSFFSSFTAAGSLSRSSIQGNTGGKTQLVGLISSLIMLVVLIRLGTLFEALPRAILAAIIWVALYGMFKQFKDIYRYGKLCWWDAVVWVVVFLATVLLGVDLGLGVGVGFSLLVIVLRIILPTSSVLGEAHEADEAFRSMDNFEKVETIPGILIFRFQAPICFVNCRVFRLRLEIACGLLNKTALKLNRNTEGCLQKLCYKVGVTHKGSYSVTSQEDMVGFSAKNSSVNIKNSPSNISKINHLQAIEPVHTVVIDCAPIGFMDAVGVKTLQQIVTDFDKLGIQVIFVCMTKENRDIMGRSGFFRKCSKKWLFASMQDAIRHAQYEPVLHPEDEPTLTNESSHGNGVREDASSNSSSSLPQVKVDEVDAGLRTTSTPPQVTVVQHLVKGDQPQQQASSKSKEI